MNSAYLLHVPKERHYVYPFKTVNFVNFMSLGLIPIAAYAAENGYPTKIIHVGLEKILDTNYTIEMDLERDKPKVIGISMHWHHTSYNVIELAREVKKKHKKIYIVLGGYTASFFADEILSQFEFVDGIIRGEGEVPWTALLRQINNGGNLHNVPNLLWRKGEQIISNEISYVADDNLMNSLDFTSFDLVKHNQYLPKLFWVFLLKNPKFNNILLQREIDNTFYFTSARGCFYNCFYCGGGEKAALKLSKRSKPVFLTPERIFFHVKKALEFGFTRASINIDSKMPKDYFKRLIDEFLVNNIRDKVWFTIYGLPSRWLVDRLADVFTRDVGITITLDTASETYRRKIGRDFFTNDDFFVILEKIKKCGLRLDLFFTDNLPGETKNMKQETRRMIKKIKNIYRNVNIFRQNMDLDPACPLFFSPDKYGVVIKRKTFFDYYCAHAKDKINPGFIEKNDSSFNQDRQLSVFQKGVFAALINFVISLPIAHVFLKGFLLISGFKSLKRQN